MFIDGERCLGLFSRLAAVTPLQAERFLWRRFYKHYAPNGAPLRRTRVYSRLL
jgi:hypothetical protein